MFYVVSFICDFSRLTNDTTVIQVAFEGQISKASVQSELAKGNKASGDLIPWTMSQQYNDTEFAGLSGARVIRIATHPDVQKLGYGSRAMDLLISYFQGDLTDASGTLDAGVFGGESGTLEEMDFTSLSEENVAPRKTLPPLLTPVSDRPAEKLHWIGVSFGLTGQLLSFWCKKDMRVCYVRQTANDITGEHSTIMLRELACEDMQDAPAAGWLRSYVLDYRRRLISLAAYSFKKFDTTVSLTLLDPERELSGANETTTRVYNEYSITANELLRSYMSHNDIARLELYSRNMVDHHMILDLLPSLSRLYFFGRMPSVHLSALQMAILLACGLQHRDADDVTRELGLPANQILAFFNKTIRKLTSFLREILEKHIADELPSDDVIKRMEKRAEGMVSSKRSLKEDQLEDENEFRSKQRSLIMAHKDLSSHAIALDETQMDETVLRLSKKTKTIPSTVSFESSKNDQIEMNKISQLHKPDGSMKQKKKKKLRKEDE